MPGVSGSSVITTLIGRHIAVIEGEDSRLANVALTLRAVLCASRARVWVDESCEASVSGPMNLIAAVDEVASETQVVEGWAYALLPINSVTAIDVAVRSSAVRVFHGKHFKKSEAADYRALLKATRQQMERAP